MTRVFLSQGYQPRLCKPESGELHKRMHGTLAASEETGFSLEDSFVFRTLRTYLQNKGVSAAFHATEVRQRSLGQLAVGWEFACNRAASCLGEHLFPPHMLRSLVLAAQRVCFAFLRTANKAGSAHISFVLLRHLLPFGVIVVHKVAKRRPTSWACHKDEARKCFARPLRARRLALHTLQGHGKGTALVIQGMRWAAFSTAEAAKGMALSRVWLKQAD